MTSQGSDGGGSGGTQRDGGGSGTAATRKRTWTHNGIEFTSEPYEWKGKMFFAVNTGGGLESIFVEEGSTVWAHYEKDDYKMIAGQDNSWVRQLRPNQKNMQQQVSEKEIEDELWQAAAQDTDPEQKEETGEGKKKKETGDGKQKKKKRSRAEAAEWSER